MKWLPFLIVFVLGGCGGASSAPVGESTAINETATANLNESSDAAPESSSPARFYSQEVSVVLQDDETAMWKLVSSALGNRCARDGALTLAARKHASDVLQHSTVVKENGIDYLRYALRLYGSADYLISPFVFDWNDEGKAALLRMMGEHTEVWTHCGVGIHQYENQKKAVFIAATRVISLKAIPVQPKVGSRLSMSGILVGDENSDVNVFLELPNGHVQRLKSYVLGKKRFSVTVPFETEGKYTLELMVTRGSGPETAALLPLYVGIPVDTRPSIFPVNDDAVSDPRETMTLLINRIRRNMGLHPLVRDVRLDEVAQSHCRDMAASESFGHFSQSSGMLADRLKAKQLYPRLTAENIAQSSSLMRVHHNLMQSPSHKIKLLTPEFTHLGLGVVEHDGVTVVTQVFAAW
ncbi:MAG: CAP domain-containing protein [Deltaproteobacteria bacterium]|nr:CAP domain-containing protein [Deltaproteobacteria bacterium]MBN2671036.1 CAP domain-containing protein [Deltaproteobacteria bacterium]